MGAILNLSKGANILESFSLVSSLGILFLLFIYLSIETDFHIELSIKIHMRASVL